jgi:NADH-quinone oxidoreductase subunit A
MLTNQTGANVFDLAAYLPILLIFIVALGFALTNIVVSQVIGQRKATRTKLMPYECGKDPVGSARERFSVKFYLIAMIFILFDIEVIFLIPWAVVFKSFIAPRPENISVFSKEYLSYGWQNLTSLISIEMLLFIVLLFIGYIYVLKKGAFEWGERARVEAEAEARVLAEQQTQSKASGKAVVTASQRAA